MTVTKRDILKALAQVDDDAVIFIDDGIDSIECRGVTVMNPNTMPEDDFDDISTQPDGAYVPDGSVVLRLAN